MNASAVHTILAEGGIDGIDHVIREPDGSYTAVFWVAVQATYLFIDQLAVEEVIDLFLLYHRTDYVPMILNVEHGQMAEGQPGVIMVEVFAHFSLYTTVGEIATV